MLLFCLAALAAFLILAQRRADAIRVRVGNRRADIPRALQAPQRGQGAGAPRRSR